MLSVIQELYTHHDDIEQRVTIMNDALDLVGLKVVHDSLTKLYNKKLRYREEHSASVVLSWCTL